MASDSQTWRVWLIRGAKVLLFAIVAWFVWRAIGDAHRKFTAEKISLFDLNLAWLGIAGGCFLLSQLPLAWFWHRAMRTLGQSPAGWRSLTAYLVGGLGKYVPGKAMVVALRAGMVRGSEVDTTVAALCVFIETLTMMAVGGFLGAIYLACVQLAWGTPSPLLLMAVGLALATGLPTWPPLFRRAVRLLQLSRAKADLDQLLLRLDLRLMASGWAANLVAWPLMGLSLWATLRAMPGMAEPLGDPLSRLPLLTAATALSVVAGFLSMLPGGFGARELVLNEMLRPEFGETAIVAVILLRLVWVLSEVVISAILYLCRGSAPGAAAAPADPADTK